MNESLTILPRPLTPQLASVAFPTSPDGNCLHPGAQAKNPESSLTIPLTFYFKILCTLASKFAFNTFLPSAAPILLQAPVTSHLGSCAGPQWVSWHVLLPPAACSPHSNQNKPAKTLGGAAPLLKTLPQLPVSLRAQGQSPSSAFRASPVWLQLFRPGPPPLAGLLDAPTREPLLWLLSGPDGCSQSPSASAHPSPPQQGLPSNLLSDSSTTLPCLAFLLSTQVLLWNL